MDAGFLADPDACGACSACSDGDCNVACGRLNGGSCDQVCCGDPWSTPTPGASGFLLAALALSPAAVAAPRSTYRWSWPRRLGLLTIRGYQRWISVRLPFRCRFVPSCSQYGRAAVERYGLVTGSRIALGRILRCTKAVPHGTPDPLDGPGS